MSSPRDATVDALRGLAVLVMIPANLAALAYAQPHAPLFRLAGSFAAPLFVCLAGYMVAATGESKRYGLGHFALRGAMLLVVAVLIDLLVWRITPFVTCDVLYLIGIATPLVYLLRRIPGRPAQAGIIAALFAAAPLLQLLLGYADYPSGTSLLTGPWPNRPVDETGVLNHYLVDGWFPLFPWLGFGLLGSLLADLRGEGSKAGRPRRRRLSFRAGMVGLAFLLVGAAVWYAYPGAMLVRAGYSELFYPPVPGFLLTAVGVIVTLFALMDEIAAARVLQPLRLLGEAALLMYILHLILDRYLIYPLWPDRPLPSFALIVIVVQAGLIGLGLALRRLKSRWPERPMPVRFLLGG